MQRKWSLAAVFAAFLIIGAIARLRTSAPADNTPAVSYEAAGLRVRIDVSERQLYVEENGETIRTFGVAVGTKSHPTPRGSYSLRRVIWNPRWVPPKSKWAEDKIPRAPGDPKNPMGRVKIFFREPDYYLHGTNDTGSIGTAASHGCVRLRNDDIIDLAKILMDRGGAAVEPGLIRRLINQVRSTREVRLSRTIPLRIQS